MSFDCRGWITVAQKLMSAPPGGLEEAFWRTAIGRSYYCVYGLATRLLLFEGLPEQSIDNHSEVRKRFRSHRQRDRVKIGENLGTLYEERRKADYNPKIKITGEKAQFAYQLANETMQLLDRLLQSYSGRQF